MFWKPASRRRSESSAQTESLRRRRAESFAQVSSNRIDGTEVIMAFLTQTKDSAGQISLDSDNACRRSRARGSVVTSGTWLRLRPGASDAVGTKRPNGDDQVKRHGAAVATRHTSD